MRYQLRNKMRTIVFRAIAFGLLFGVLPSLAVHAQDGGIAQLSAAAYAPDSPVRENKLFQYQTGHYGFAYNCDGEECKRNNPAIRWRKADQCQLPRRMGCLQRVRHEAAQVSRRILDGMCNSDCQVCQRQSSQSVTQSCGCAACLTNQESSDSITGSTSLADTGANEPRESYGLLTAKQLKTLRTVTTTTAENPKAAKRSRSGLISLTRLEPATKVELAPGESLVGAIEVLPSKIAAIQTSVKPVQRPIARITSATVGSEVELAAKVSRKSLASEATVSSPPSPSTGAHQMNLLKRLKQVRSAKASGFEKPAKF